MNNTYQQNNQKEKQKDKNKKLSETSKDNMLQAFDLLKKELNDENRLC